MAAPRKKKPTTKLSSAEKVGSPIANAEPLDVTGESVDATISDSNAAVKELEAAREIMKEVAKDLPALEAAREIANLVAKETGATVVEVSEFSATFKSLNGMEGSSRVIGREVKDIIRGLRSIGL